ncbi:MAG: glutamine synthetase type III, partial [Lachnospiraceae bacterium]|nr:glutamine synthetase type III [Lachnospiraceae bacterium]
SASIANANIILNTIIADALGQAADILEKADDFEMALHDLIKKWASEHLRIVFNGDGYSQEWVKEAKRRGLPNISNTVDAIEYITWKKAVKLFEKHHVLTKTELTSRREVAYESYSKSVNIEARTMVNMSSKQIMPAVIKYMNILSEAVISAEKTGASAAVPKAILKKCSADLGKLYKATENVKKLLEEAAGYPEGKERAVYYRDKIIPAMALIREPADRLEQITDDTIWPYPTYGELLFNEIK